MKINGSQIRPGQIETSHIKGKLAESALNINYADSAKAQSILEAKKVIDGVTLVTPIAVTASASSVTGITLSTTPAPNSTSKGVVLSELVDVVNAVDGEVILDASGDQVYANLSFVDPTYNLSFVKSDGVTATAIPDAQDIKIQYYIREDLWSISERFLRNERLAEGLIDVTQQKNTDQIIADLFGAGYSLNRDGLATELFSGNTDLETKNLKEALLFVYNELLTARTDKDAVTHADVSTRIDATETAIETLEESGHSHFKGHEVIETDNGDSSTVVTFVVPNAKTTDGFAVYYNGGRQIVTAHYTIAVTPNANPALNEVAVTFTEAMTGTIASPDYVELEATIANS